MVRQAITTWCSNPACSARGLGVCTSGVTDWTRGPDGQPYWLCGSCRIEPPWWLPIPAWVLDTDAWMAACAEVEALSGQPGPCVRYTERAARTSAWLALALDADDLLRDARARAEQGAR